MKPKTKCKKCMGIGIFDCKHTTDKSKKSFPDYLVVPKDTIKVSRNGFTNWDKNPVAKKIKQDNLARIMDTASNVEKIRKSMISTMVDNLDIDSTGIKFYEDKKIIKDSLWRWNGNELKPYDETKLFFIGSILVFALGILFVHFLFVMPILS